MHNTLLAANNGVGTKDQEKTTVAVRLLAHYARTRRRFFLAVGLASTHVHGSAICIPDAARAEGARPIGNRAPLAPHRGDENDPPLLTWPNWDLTQWDRGARKQVPRFGIDPAWERDAIGQYYACATHVDAQIGALLDALNALHLEQSTSVVVQGDHGFSLGRHGRWSKYNMYEDATRVPLLIAVPGQPAPRVVGDVIESLDVMPTVLDLWGVARSGGDPKESATSLAAGSSLNSAALISGSPLPAAPIGAMPRYKLSGVAVPLDGDSLLPYIVPHGKDGGRAPRRRTYARSEMREWMVVHKPNDRLLPGAPPRYALGKGEALYLRTERYAYTAFLYPICRSCGSGSTAKYRLLDEALYDVRTDAGEAHNLAYSAAHASSRQALLRTLMRDWNMTVIQHLDGWDVSPLRLPNRTQRVNWLRYQISHGAETKRQMSHAKEPSSSAARSGRGGQGSGGRGAGGKNRGGAPRGMRRGRKLLRNARAEL